MTEIETQEEFQNLFHSLLEFVQNEVEYTPQGTQREEIQSYVPTPIEELKKRGPKPLIEEYRKRTGGTGGGT